MLRNEDYHVFKYKIYKIVAYIKQHGPYYLEYSVKWDMVSDLECYNLGSQICQGSKPILQYNVKCGGREVRRACKHRREALMCAGLSAQSNAQLIFLGTTAETRLKGQTLPKNFKQKKQ